MTDAENHKMGPSEHLKKTKISPDEKADLKTRLPGLMQEALVSSDVGAAAIRAAIRLRVPIPASLLDSERIASALDLKEIAQSLRFLQRVETEVDLSGPLSAIRKKSAEIAQAGSFT